MSLAKVIASTTAVLLTASFSAFAQPAKDELAFLPSAASVAPERHLIEKTPLAWPKNEDQGREAQVVLVYTVEPDGTVADVKVVGSPNPAFAEAAKASVSTWRYEPARAATPNVKALALFHAAP